LKEKELKSVALLTIGYRDAENDWNANLIEVSRPKDKLFLNIEKEAHQEAAASI
jgi:hypothetical protein